MKLRIVSAREWERTLRIIRSWGLKPRTQRERDQEQLQEFEAARRRRLYGPGLTLEDVLRRLEREHEE